MFAVIKSHGLLFQLFLFERKYLNEMQLEITHHMREDLKFTKIPQFFTRFHLLSFSHRTEQKNFSVSLFSQSHDHDDFPSFPPLDSLSTTIITWNIEYLSRVNVDRRLFNPTRKFQTKQLSTNKNSFFSYSQKIIFLFFLRFACVGRWVFSIFITFSKRKCCWANTTLSTFRQFQQHTCPLKVFQFSSFTIIFWSSKYFHINFSSFSALNSNFMHTKWLLNIFCLVNG